MAIRYEYLFHVTALFDLTSAGGGRMTTRRLWTGDGDITLDGAVYTPTAAVAGVEVAGGSFVGIESRLTVELFATDDTLRTALLQDPGPAQVSVGQAYSLNDTTWQMVPRMFTGRVSNPVLDGDRYRVDLVDRYGDPLRPLPRYWSDEDQQRRFPGDRGLRYVRQIEAGVRVDWP